LRREQRRFSVRGLKRSGYVILIVVFVLFSLVSLYSMARVKSLHHHLYQVPSAAQRDVVDAHAREWMIVGVIAVTFAGLMFIGLIMVPAVTQLDRAAKRRRQLRKPPE
jgi:Na+/proline symporter